MNTYDIQVKGKPVLQEIRAEDLEDKLKEIRGLVWVSGGRDQDIKVTKHIYKI